MDLREWSAERDEASTVHVPALYGEFDQVRKRGIVASKVRMRREFTLFPHGEDEPRS